MHSWAPESAMAPSVLILTYPFAVGNVRWSPGAGDPRRRCVGRRVWHCLEWEAGDAHRGQPPRRWVQVESICRCICLLTTFLRPLVCLALGEATVLTLLIWVIVPSPIGSLCIVEVGVPLPAFLVACTRLYSSLCWSVRPKSLHYLCFLMISKLF